MTSPLSPNDASPPTAKTGMASLALAEKAFIVDRALAEGLELFEARMYRAGLRVERRVMVAERFYELCRCEGELVPKATR